MSEFVSCPQCGAPFELTALVRAQVEGDVRRSLSAEGEQRLARVREEEAATRARELAKQGEELARLRAQLTLSTKAEDEARQRATELAAREVEWARTVEERVEAERAKAAALAAEQVEARLQAAAVEKERELAEARARLAATEAHELSLREKMRALAEREAEARVVFERRVDEERERIRASFERENEERAARRIAEAVDAKERELVEARARLAASAAAAAELERAKRLLAEREAALALDVEQRVAGELEKARAEAERVAEERHRLAAAEAVRAKDEELALLRRRADAAAQKELDVARRERLLEETEHARKLDAEARLAAEAKRIREETEARARDEQRLRDEESRQREAAMQRTIDALQQQARQVPQQRQGEAQEVVLRELLERAFPRDEFTDVAKGERGADVVQRVFDETGRDCGTILWESKRTRGFSDGWLPKLRDDKQEAGAAIAVLVSQTLPSDLDGFGERDGVLLCGRPHAIAVAALLRAQLVELARTRRAGEGRSSKEALLYRYVTSGEFHDRFDSLVRTSQAMSDQLQRERTVMNRVWKQREVQIERLLGGLSAAWGAMDEISGGTMAELEPLALDAVAGPMLALAAGDEPDRLPTLDDRFAPADASLVTLLYSLVPESGDTIGNKSLFERFAEEARYRLSTEVTPGDYERCRAALLAAGRLRKGKGQGGSVSRVLVEEPLLGV